MTGGLLSDTARLEAVERDACADLWAAAPAVVRSAFGVAHRRIGSGVLLTAPGLDGSLVFNRFLGYGIDGDVLGEEVDGAIAAFEAAGTRTWTIQVAPTAVGLGDIARARGLEAHPRDWVRFARPAEPAEAASGGLMVRAARPGDAEAFGAILCASFGAPGGVADWVAALVGRTRWRCFLAWDGEEPVGIGALYLGEGLGWLGFGGTLPGHRGRGAQMFAARIAAGLAAGCRGFVTETGAPLPGEASPSFRNIGRAGFREVYRRPNYWRPAHASA